MKMTDASFARKHSAHMCITHQLGELSRAGTSRTVIRDGYLTGTDDFVDEQKIVTNIASDCGGGHVIPARVAVCSNSGLIQGFNTGQEARDGHRGRVCPDRSHDGRYSSGNNFLKKDRWRFAAKASASTRPRQVLVR